MNAQVKTGYMYTYVLKTMWYPNYWKKNKKKNIVMHYVDTIQWLKFGGRKIIFIFASRLNVFLLIFF